MALNILSWKRQAKTHEVHSNIKHWARTRRECQLVPSDFLLKSFLLTLVSFHWMCDKTHIFILPLMLKVTYTFFRLN